MSLTWAQPGKVSYPVINNWFINDIFNRYDSTHSPLVVRIDSFIVGSMQEVFDCTGVTDSSFSSFAVVVVMKQLRVFLPVAVWI